MQKFTTSRDGPTFALAGLFRPIYPGSVAQSIIGIGIRARVCVTRPCLARMSDKELGTVLPPHAPVDGGGSLTGISL